MGSLKEENNVYAFNIEGIEIHISQAKSGRKGYFCLGCKREMQAVISRKENRTSYFRHDPKDVKKDSKCVYRDETYRHKLAKNILQRLKKIKVPALYKYPPKDTEGQAYLIEEAKYVEASEVKIERTFYEDEFGKISYGRNPEIDERYLIVKPDVTFFDSEGNPVLFIEIVVTHKITLNKLVRLKRLGINTVQIKIPRDSPENIENNFHVTKNIKWAYNYVEERSEYLRTTNRDSEGIPPVDELQKELFEESVRCRLAQIGNLIRTITRCLESKPYSDAEEGLRSALSRVKGNTERNRQGLEQLREEHRQRVYRTFEDRFEEVGKNELSIEEETWRIAEKYQELESRYNTKANSIKEEERDNESRIQKEIDSLGGEGSSIEERKRQLNREEEKVDADLRSAQEKLKDIGGRRKRLPSYYEAVGTGLRNEFSESERTAIEAIKSRSFRGNDRLSTEIKETLQTRELIGTFKTALQHKNRKREAWECFKSGAWKNWPE